MQHPVLTTETFGPLRGRDGISADHLPPAERAFYLYRPALADFVELPALGEHSDEAAAAARIDNGRWIADCPFGCGSAQVVTPEDPRYLCAGTDGCANVAVGGAYVSVQFPPPAARLAAEAVLASRPSRRNLNWLPGESPAELAAENEREGVPVSAEAVALLRKAGG